MTTLIEDLQALLDPLAAGGCTYIINTDEPPVVPYITFQFIVSTTNNSLAGASDLQNTRVQIDIFAQGPSDMVSISAALESAMAGASFTNVQLSQQDLYEDPVRLFRRMYDYSVWSKN